MHIIKLAENVASIRSAFRHDSDYIGNELVFWNDAFKELKQEANTPLSRYECHCRVKQLEQLERTLSSSSSEDENVVFLRYKTAAHGTEETAAHEPEETAVGSSTGTEPSQ